MMSLGAGSTALVLATVVAGQAVWADVIQFTQDSDGSYLTYSPVTLRNGTEYEAFTDQTGQIIVDVPEGEYRVTIEVDGQSYDGEPIYLDGDAEIKTVRIDR